MRFSRLIRATMVLGIASSATFFACGGDDGGSGGGGGGGGGGGVDGGIHQIDASGGGSDASSSGGLTGLLQSCTTNADCPANAPECIALGLGGSNASTAYCTPHCLDNGSGTTDGSGQLTSTTPPPDDTACSSAFTGSAGMPACGVILATTPDDNPLMPNTNYTGITLGCVVVCGSGASACPDGTTCNTSLQICFPN